MFLDDINPVSKQELVSAAHDAIMDKMTDWLREDGPDDWLAQVAVEAILEKLGLEAP